MRKIDIIKLSIKSLEVYGVPEHITKGILKDIMDLDDFGATCNRFDLHVKLDKIHNALAHSACDKEHYDVISSLLIEAKAILQPHLIIEEDNQ